MNSADERILILAITHKDSEYTRRVLEANGLAPFICPDMDTLLREILRGAGALLLARETLQSRKLFELSATLQALPSWSYLPIVILTMTGDIAEGKSEALSAMSVLRNVTFLGRPVCLATLLSVLSAAIADRKRQYEVRDLLKAVEGSRNEAIRANKAKSDFLANMSHEIRTPLGTVIGFSELISEPNLSDQERETYAMMIKRNGELLSALINDILDLAKVEAGRIELESLEIPLRELFSDVISTLQPRAAKKGLRLVVETSGLAANLVKTDPIRLKQILINIIGNAIKFTNTGEIYIEFTSRRPGTEESELRATIRDTGIGISPEQETRLFKTFSQADSSTTRAFGGSGLGLVLSRELTRAMGGNLRLVDSQPGKGSTFELTIRVLDLAQNPAQSLSGPGEGSAKALIGLRVLLVEDSPDNQFLISRILSLAGIEVALANDGVEGTELALSQDFDVILMDVQMPKMSGDEAIGKLRESGYAKPVIALTAHALKGDRERCLNAGFDDYLTKPIQRAALMDVLVSYARS